MLLQEIRCDVADDARALDLRQEGGLALEPLDRGRVRQVCVCSRLTAMRRPVALSVAESTSPNDPRATCSPTAQLSRTSTTALRPSARGAVSS